MNSLSVGIYLTYVFSTASTGVEIIAALSIISALIATFSWWVSIDEKSKKPFKRAMIILFSIGALSIFLKFVIPDRTTMLMILASEVAGNAISSENVDKLSNPAMSYLETWLKSEVERMNKENVSRN